MTDKSVDDDSGERTYQEREAVAVFDDEASLDKAVDALMQFGLRQADMSVLADAGKLSAAKQAKQIEDADDAPHAGYVTPGSRTEAAALSAAARLSSPAWAPPSLSALRVWR